MAIFRVKSHLSSALLIIEVEITQYYIYYLKLLSIDLGDC
jgi:hypothetical protein